MFWHSKLHVVYISNFTLTCRSEIVKRFFGIFQLFARKWHVSIYPNSINLTCIPCKNCIVKSSKIKKIWVEMISNYYFEGYYRQSFFKQDELVFLFFIPLGMARDTCSIFTRIQINLNLKCTCTRLQLQVRLLCDTLNLKNLMWRRL